MLEAIFQITTQIMKTIKYLMAVLAIVSSTAAWGQQTENSNNALDGYSECREIAEIALQYMLPTEEAVDSTCYLLGVNYGLMFKGNGFFEEFSQIHLEEFIKGMKDAMEIGEPSVPYGTDEDWAKQFKVSPYDMNTILNEHLDILRAYKKALNTMIGDQFLKENAKRDGVKTTESGLQYILHAEGEGDKVQPEDVVIVNYRGYLLDGREFDSDEEFRFAANQVIKGWTEGLGLIGKGGKITLFIPSHLAYGEKAPRGSIIEPNMLIVFDVELLDIIR